jgi:hypothetical protein
MEIGFSFYIICFGFVKFAKFVVSQVVMLDGEEGKRGGG